MCSGPGPGWNDSRNTKANGATKSPLLMDKVKVYRNSIVAKDGSFIQARSADADTAHGYNAHAVLI